MAFDLGKVITDGTRRGLVQYERNSSFGNILYIEYAIIAALAGAHYLSFKVFIFTFLALAVLYAVFPIFRLIYDFVIACFAFVVVGGIVGFIIPSLWVVLPLAFMAFAFVFLVHGSVFDFLEDYVS